MPKTVRYAWYVGKKGLNHVLGRIFIGDYKIVGFDQAVKNSISNLGYKITIEASADDDEKLERSSRLLKENGWLHSYKRTSRWKRDDG